MPALDLLSLTPSLRPGTDTFERRAARTFDRPYLLDQGELQGR